MVEGWWKDTGKPEDLLEANRMMLSTLERRVDGEVDDTSRLEGTVVVEPGAKVVDSTVLGPAIVGRGTLVEGSTIGPDAAISAGCEIRGSGVADSIVMEGCRIVGVPAIEGSILGRGVEVLHAGGRGPHRLVLGDQSRVEVVDQPR
jgi:glucose-1-phosphate thymidylyltransferase